MKLRCRHQHSWLIAGGHYEWCAECGALRPLVVAPAGNTCSLSPTMTWAYPTPGNPPHGFAPRTKPLARKEER
jgi:hypothetical protein